jgi:hypothetical protein
MKNLEKPEKGYKDFLFDNDMGNYDYDRKMSRSQQKEREIDPEYKGIEKEINIIN